MTKGMDNPWMAARPYAGGGTEREGKRVKKVLISPEEAAADCREIDKLASLPDVREKRRVQQLGYRARLREGTQVSSLLWLSAGGCLPDCSPPSVAAVTRPSGRHRNPSNPSSTSWRS
jgi:poly(3-hydroxybutyrate) depolymerase